MMTPPENRSVSEWDFAVLLAAAQRGEEEPKDELFRRFYPRVQQIVHRALATDMRRKRPWLMARFSTGDVVQEVFRSLLMDLSGFKGESDEAFVGYLSMVVRNRLVDAVRYHEAALRDGRRCQGIDCSDDAASRAAGPATGAAMLDEMDLLNSIFDTLPESEQLLLRGRFEQEARFVDLAKALGYSSASAAKRVFYAAQAKLTIRMRKALADSSGEGKTDQ